MSYIKLHPGDDEIIDVEVEIAKCSVTIRTMLEDLEMDEEEQVVILLPNQTSAVLKKVIEWVTYHKNDPPLPEEDEKDFRTATISSWDSNFLKVHPETLLKLMLAAEDLDIKGLVRVTCATVANMIDGKTRAQIRRMFNIKNLK